MDYDRAFADKVAATLEAARYEILDDHRDEEPRPMPIFVGERSSEDLCTSVVVSFVQGWDMVMNEVRGDSCRQSDLLVFIDTDELREFIEAPWKKRRDKVVK